MKISTAYLKTTVRDFLTGARILLFLVIVLLALLVVWLGVDINNKASESENTIIVSATSEVYATPDLALMTFSVTAEAETVAEAMAENTAKMNAVIESVESQGVEDKDLKTVNFSIYPRYEWRQETVCLVPPCPSGERVLVGYEVHQSLQIKMRDLAKIGDIIQGATEKGANQVSDLQFTIDNEDALKEQAREQAIEEAKDKAKTLADQLDVKLVRIINFNESTQVPFPYYSYNLEEAMGGKGGEAPQIETGENKVSVSVTITYQIR